MNRRRTGASLLEVVVVVAILALLIGILIPTASAVRHRAYIDRCADNLRQIGVALALYARDHDGALPRTTYVPGAPVTFGTGILSGDVAAGTSALFANDVTAALFLLRKSQKLPAGLFLCPYTDSDAMRPDPAVDLGERLNFTDYRRHLGYSVLNVYPADPAVAAAFNAKGVLREEFAVAADLNPGTHGDGDDVLGHALPSDAGAVTRAANSRNHDKTGQNVLYGDGRVEWQTSALCGVKQDNVYATQVPGIVEGPAVTTDDSVLLPTDDHLPAE
ncbi:MAG TPA: hypothetical protein VK324_04595 [Tepidisphaeraceae bacterium]|nr:hypothetical protein [Tepidisphaeraceae bacterium]